MYYDDHNPPHFHAWFGAYNISIDIKTLGVIAGHLPPKIHASVIRWASYHREELLKNWEKCRNGEQPEKIRPLKL